MTDTWGQLSDSAKDVLRNRAVGHLSEEEVAQRIRVDDEGRLRFRLFGAVPAIGANEAFAGEAYAIGAPPPREVTLIPPDEFDYEAQPTGEDAAAAAPVDEMIAPLKEYFAEDPGLLDEAAAAEPDSTLPAIIDHRPVQSPVKHQGQRGTCVAHASLGLLETAAHIPDDLSEQFAHFKFNELSNRPHNTDSGLQTTDAAQLLAREDARVCLEHEWPYIADQSTINAAVDAGSYAPPASAAANQAFGYGAYKIIADLGVEGESIKNTRYLESLLALGLDIVFGAWASWDDENNRDVLRPLLGDDDQPIITGGHAMLLVGYDRPGQYFIVKNSWGTGWGHAGYGYFHYDFMRSCAKYGFTVSEMAPAA